MNMKKYCRNLVAILCLLVLGLPQAQAAGTDITLTSNVTVNLSGPAINLTLLSGSTMESYTVDTTSITFDLDSGSSVTVRSADFYDLTNTLAANTCHSTYTETFLTASSSASVTITPSTTVSCGGSSSGSGGGFSPPVNPNPNPGLGLQQPPSYLVGSLINQGGTIYLITAPYVAVGFTTWPAFVGLGYQVRYVIQDNLVGYRVPTDYFLSSATQSHPWTAWVISGRTVYYISSEGLIGVPTWDIFLSDGGQEKYILPANVNDLQILKAHPNLPLLQPNDSRVVR